MIGYLAESGRTSIFDISLDDRLCAMDSFIYLLLLYHFYVLDISIFPWFLEYRIEVLSFVYICLTCIYFILQFIYFVFYCLCFGRFTSGRPFFKRRFESYKSSYSASRMGFRGLMTKGGFGDPFFLLTLFFLGESIHSGCSSSPLPLKSRSTLSPC